MAESQVFLDRTKEPRVGFELLVTPRRNSPRARHVVPRTAPPAWRGTHPERDEEFESNSRESANLRFLRPPSHVERPVRVLVVREGSMVRIRARRPSWKALSEPRNSLRMAILPVWRSGCGSSTPPVHSRSRHLAGLCIRRLFGRAFTLIE